MLQFQQSACGARFPLHSFRSADQVMNL
jgi:hypothetical protein